MGERVAGEAGAGPAEGFAPLLRELKDRSGLSYGTLAKRLHMSTSTLHRYCNGTAVPNDYAPVERLARACKASPQELVELHRRWVLADAARAAASQVRREGGEGRTGETPAAREPESTGSVGAAGEPGVDVPVVPVERAVVGVPDGSAAPRARRTALAASAAAAILVVAALLAVHPPWAGDGSADGNPSDAADRKTAGAAAPRDTPTPDTSTAPTPSAGAGKAGDRKTAGASATPSSPAPDTSAAPTAGSAAVPITVRTRPYVYDNPCSQHFLVDSVPAQMGPPANEENAPRWAASYGAVSSDEQRVALTVQGAGSRTVVLEALHVSIESRNAPLAWNDYAMGVGCGGGVETKSFDVDLDSGSPTVTVRNGQRAFPYSVSETDPEVFYVTAHTKAHDVRWDLTLDWSSGSRHGTVRVDNDGTPFRTSADVDRPGYDYPLGGSDWTPRAG